MVSSYRLEASSLNKKYMELVKPSTNSPSKELLNPDVSATPDWCSLYMKKPLGYKSLFQLEALVAKRMELLAWIDQIVSSPTAASFDSILKEIGLRLREEARNRSSKVAEGPILGSDYRVVSGGEKREPLRSDQDIHFEEGEDLISHLLCRFAFCMSERWRKWFVKNEEILLRARLRLEIEKDVRRLFLVDIMRENNLPCEPLDESVLLDPVFLEYIEYRKRDGSAQGEKPSNFFAVPVFLASRLVKSRSVLLRKGKAILYRDQVQEVFLTVFRGQLNRGLHSAFLARIKQQRLTEETERLNVMHMLDAFLEHFISDPSDNLEEGKEGSIRAGDVSTLSRMHFPLCMRQIDSHLRREGHLKHHGRFSYGLFLKAIGLSLEDSLQLFSSLMSVKGGGSVESFSKTSYGYNVRHNYGLEGKKTSYTSASCATLLSLPPPVDRNDCHGCPFRFRDETRFRNMLKQSQLDPRGQEHGEVSPSLSDIEEIVADCKGQHYTRACFRYFMATHPNAKRDSLFRSPYEYFVTSRELEETVAPGTKRIDDVSSESAPNTTRIKKE